MEIEQKLYSISKAAKILGISTQSIRAWDKKGILKVCRTLGGFRMVPIEEINRLLNNSIKGNL
jgi:DNA-binding transcriptional MerR regulator